jgi:hypothetical protein
MCCLLLYEMWVINQIQFKGHERDRIFLSLKMSDVITEEHNAVVSSEKLIGTTV